MNVHQVNQEWWQHARADKEQQAQRHARLAAESSQRMRAAHAWVSTTFPALADDPFLLRAALTLKAEAPDRPVTRARVIEWTRALHAGRHDRGYINAAELAAELADLDDVS